MYSLCVPTIKSVWNFVEKNRKIILILLTYALNQLVFSNNYNRIPWRDSISRPIIPQADMIPIDHAARAQINSFAKDIAFF
jgi:hypothetical protein